MIDARAIIHPEATLADNVSIGPWTVIGPQVSIGADTHIGPHCVINGPTKIGQGNKIFQFSSVGEEPQDKKYQGEETWLQIGNNNVIREYCTLNRGTVQGGGVTKIGDNNLLMAYVHIAHDCIVHNHAIFANNAALAGHVTVCDYAILSGFTGIHQFCTVGEYSFLAYGARVTKDVMPFVLVAGSEKPAAYGLNIEGLRRHGFANETITLLRQAYKIVYRQGIGMKDAIKQLDTIKGNCDEIVRMMTFMQQTTRGII